MLTRVSLSLAAALVCTTAAQAQYYGNPCSTCSTPMTSVASCTPVQPAYSTCYQTVPVTTYRREQQTVQVPYYKTEYEDREVTVYRPVTTPREIEVPTTSYRNVTEYRSVQRDLGRWVTDYHPVPKCAPCQVDSRPGLLGWMNRASYSMRTAFTPNYITSRRYVPNQMVCRVPVTRAVAVRGTRRVTVYDTKMVAEKKRERVAVQRLTTREETITVMRPQTAYRTIPAGTMTAFGYGGVGGYGYPNTAFAPIIIDDTRTARGPEPDPNFSDGRTTDRSNDPMFEEDSRGASRAFERGRPAENRSPVNPSAFETPVPETFGAGDAGGSSDPADFFGTEARSDNSRRGNAIPVALQSGDRPQNSAESSADAGWKATPRRRRSDDLRNPQSVITRND